MSFMAHKWAKGCPFCNRHLFHPRSLMQGTANKKVELWMSIYPIPWYLGNAISCLQRAWEVQTQTVDCKSMKRDKKLNPLMANIFRWNNQCLRMSQLNWYNMYSTSTHTSVTVEESSWSASSIGDKLVTCSFCQWPSAGRMRLNGKGWDETRELWGPEAVSMLHPCSRRSAVPLGLLEAKDLPSIVPNLQVFRF